MPLPQMLPVTSTNISAIGYESETETLYITFLSSGRTYKYEAVPPGEYALLERADSKGSHFAQNIKGQYKTTPA